MLGKPRVLGIGRYRHSTDDRRPRDDGRRSGSHRELDRRSDTHKPRAASPARRKSPAVQEPVTVPVVETPKERPVLRAGPAGGAYIPPFKLAQVSSHTSFHCPQHTSIWRVSKVLLARTGGCYLSPSHEPPTFISRCHEASMSEAEAEAERCQDTVRCIILRMC